MGTRLAVSAGLLLHLRRSADRGRSNSARQCAIHQQARRFRLDEHQLRARHRLRHGQICRVAVGRGANRLRVHHAVARIFRLPVRHAHAGKCSTRRAGTHPKRLFCSRAAQHRQGTNGVSEWSDAGRDGSSRPHVFCKPAERAAHYDCERRQREPVERAAAHDCGGAASDWVWQASARRQRSHPLVLSAGRIGQPQYPESRHDLPVLLSRARPSRELLSQRCGSQGTG